MSVHFNNKIFHIFYFRRKTKPMLATAAIRKAGQTQETAEKLQVHNSFMFIISGYVKYVCLCYIFYILSCYHYQDAKRGHLF